MGFFCCTEELEDSALPSSTENHSELPEHVSHAAELTASLTAPDTLSDSGVAPAETSPLCSESADPQSFLIESSGSPSPPLGVLSLPEDPPGPSSLDLIPTPAADEAPSGQSQVSADMQAAVYESEEPVPHQSSEEEAEKTHSD